MLHTYKQQEVSYVSHPQLLSSGFLHGFTGKSLSPGGEALEDFRARFCDSFKVSELNLLKQVHGVGLVHAGECSSSSEDTLPVGDAILFSRTSNDGIRRAYGIRTADCLPVLFVGATTCVLVHAGWRGFAKGILEQSLDALLKYDPIETIFSLIGPAAGGKKYEVGPEVIEDIGERAEFVDGQKGRYLLDLGLSAKNLLKDKGVSDVTLSTICTMSDDAYHSYRINGSQAGRNLLFAIQEPSL